MTGCWAYKNQNLLRVMNAPTDVRQHADGTGSSPSQFMGGTSSRSESANVESSQSPHTNSPSSFTQPPSGGPGDIDPNVEEVTSQNRSSNTGQRWQWEDDEPLISAWLNVEQDPVVGDNQAGTTSWERIHQYCLEVDHKRFSTKKSNALKQRFHKIRTTVSSFYGFYAQADRSKRTKTNASGEYTSSSTGDVDINSQVHP
ncbi:hypothetical protein CRG98_030564 [Punica granatum]|uniref:Glutathione S-transferase T3-like n=1 Tax=Punica granatum TaxID=22663 RepID=A0A2I0IZE6_PUNGR|nr:hypothetical protein CRG98_030564 [Punica granatum]